METGVIYAVVAGLPWGTRPVLVKRGLAHSNVSTATLVQQTTILISLVAAALVEGAFAAEPISARAVLIFAVIGIVGAHVGWTFAGKIATPQFSAGGS